MSLTFRGLDLLSADARRVGLRIQIVRGFLVPPEVRGKDYVVAARAGQSVGNRIADQLKIGLAGTIIGATAEEWQTHRLALLAVLEEGDGIDPGELAAGGGYLGLTGGASATILARVANVIEGPILAKRLQTVSIELVSVDPAWAIVS